MGTLWDDRDFKGIWEIYASRYIFNAYLLTRLYVFAILATSPATIKESTKGGGRRRRPPPFVEATEGRLLYMVAGEVASIAKTYRRVSKYALNMYFHAYISHIPL